MLHNSVDEGVAEHLYGALQPRGVPRDEDGLRVLGHHRHHICDLLQRGFGGRSHQLPSSSSAVTGAFSERLDNAVEPLHLLVALPDVALHAVIASQEARGEVKAPRGAAARPQRLLRRVPHRHEAVSARDEGEVGGGLRGAGGGEAGAVCGPQKVSERRRQRRADALVVEVVFGEAAEAANEDAVAAAADIIVAVVGTIDERRGSGEGAFGEARGGGLQIAVGLHQREQRVAVVGAGELRDDLDRVIEMGAQHSLEHRSLLSLTPRPLRLFLRIGRGHSVRTHQPRSSTSSRGLGARVGANVQHVQLLQQLRAVLPNLFGDPNRRAGERRAVVGGGRLWVPEVGRISVGTFWQRDCAVGPNDAARREQPRLLHHLANNRQHHGARAALLGDGARRVGRAVEAVRGGVLVAYGAGEDEQIDDEVRLAVVRVVQHRFAAELRDHRRREADRVARLGRVVGGVERHAALLRAVAEDLAERRLRHRPRAVLRLDSGLRNNDAGARLVMVVTVAVAVVRLPHHHRRVAVLEHPAADGAAERKRGASGEAVVVVLVAEVRGGGRRGAAAEAGKTRVQRSTSAANGATDR